MTDLTESSKEDYGLKRAVSPRMMWLGITILVEEPIPSLV
jgi:hypothetical protein